MSPIRLVATDLDGTLIGKDSQFGLYMEFRNKLNVLRAEHGTKWAVCTGRSRRSFKHFFSPMRTVGLEPDYVIVRDAFLYSNISGRLFPNVFWNAHIMTQMALHDWRFRGVILELHRLLMAGFPQTKTRTRTKNRLNVELSSDDAAAAAATLLREKLRSQERLTLFRYRREIEIRPVPYTKGLALAELARHCGVTPETTLAVGDGHNDISMFNPAVATMIGCPVNALTEVLEVVSLRGGHVSEKPSLAGVLDVIQAHETGSVSSELPEWWEPAALRANPRAGRRPRKHSSSNLGVFALRTLLFLSTVYAGLLPFAWFGILPFSGLIRRPFVMLLRVVEKLLAAG